MDPDSVVYLNGDLLPAGQATVPAFDLGFLYGYGLFETMRARSGRIFRLSRHILRLRGSAEVIGLPLPDRDLEKACLDTLRANRLEEARVRLAISAGTGTGTPDPPDRPVPTVFISAVPYRPPSKETYRSGYRAIVSTIRQNSSSPLSRVKSANYLPNLLARSEARQAGADEALILNERGLLCEGSTTNVFLVLEGGVVTPDERSGCLPGITRQAIAELAAEVGVKFVRRAVQREELFRAEEAFLTNSLLSVVPLVEVAGWKLPGPGRITRKLESAYNDLFERETSASR